MNNDVICNLPKLLNKHAELIIEVKTQGLWRVRLGVAIIKIGARIAGMRSKVISA
jgi:hypothetical protein